MAEALCLLRPAIVRCSVEAGDPEIGISRCESGMRHGFVAPFQLLLPMRLICGSISDGVILRSQELQCDDSDNGYCDQIKTH